MRWGRGLEGQGWPEAGGSSGGGEARRGQGRGGVWVARRSGQRGPCYQRLTWGENSYIQPLKVNKLFQRFGCLCALFLAPWDPGPSLLAGGGEALLVEGAGRGEPGGCPLSSSIPALISGRADPPASGECPLLGECQLMPARPPYPRVHGHQCSLARAPLRLCHRLRAASSLLTELSSGGSCSRNQEGRRRRSLPSSRISPPPPPLAPPPAKVRAAAQLCPPAPRRTQG